MSADIDDFVAVFVDARVKPWQSIGRWVDRLASIDRERGTVTFHGTPALGLDAVSICAFDDLPVSVELGLRFLNEPELPIENPAIMRP